MSTLPNVFVDASTEIAEIMQSGGRGLKAPGHALQPVKAEMLKLPDDQASAIVQTCDLLFAACLSYEDGLFIVEGAKDAITLVTGRMKAGRAKGVVEALFYGPTAKLLMLALDRAPIAYYELSETSPDLNIIDRTFSANKSIR